MTFLSPDRLWLLALVAVVALVYVLTLLQRRRYLVRFTNVGLLDTVAPRRPGWRRHVTALAFLLALASLVVAYARPADEVRVPREKATVVLAIDTSNSMKAADVEPTRIDAAKEAAIEFSRALPPTINLGLVTFDGVARIRVTPTTDRPAVQRVIDGLELGPATAIGEAIFASIAAIEDGTSLSPDDGAGTDPETGRADTGEDEEVPARIVLMTDGDTTVGRPDLDGAEAAAQQGIEVSTIAFGTAQGVIQIDGEQGLTPVPVKESNLRDIADITGGEFFRAQTLTELEAVYADIGSAIGYDTEEREITERAVGVALALLTLSAALSLAWFARLP